MFHLLSLIFGVKDLRFRCDDEFVDRMSRRYSVSILILFALIVTTTTYVGDPITCWTPAEFTDSHKSYTNTLCWVSNTYYVSFNDHIPVPAKKDLQPMVSYYQWTPMILMFQALLCYLPSVLWAVLSRRSGLNIPALMEAASTGQRTAYTDIRDKNIRYIVTQVDRYLSARRSKSDKTRLKQILAKLCCLCQGSVHGYFLVACYFLVKVLYLLNAVGQLFMLDLLLDTDYHWYGIDVLVKIFRGEDWAANDRFPRVTLCYFKVRHMSAIRDYIVQCVLPINLFNEKIFLFVWFWLLLLGLLTFLYLLKWFWDILYTPGNARYVKRKIELSEHFKPNKTAVENFTRNYLRKDGIFILRILNYNIGNIMTSEVVAGLWNNYGPEKRNQSGIQLGRQGMDEECIDLPIRGLQFRQKDNSI